MLVLRKAEANDWARLFCWRNDKATRAAFVNTDAVSISEHMEWLKGALANERTVLLVASDQSSGIAVGTARLDKQKRYAECTVTVAPEHRGKGLSIEILSRLHTFLPPQWGCDRIVAKVKSDNWPSLRAFVSAGYVYTRQDKEYAVLERRVGG